MSHHICHIPGCKHVGKHVLCLKMRQPNTYAPWAPATWWYLCDDHAICGADIEIIYRPRKTGKIAMDTHAPAKPGMDDRRIKRTITIKAGLR